MDEPGSAPNFCSECGKSLRPLNVPHITYECGVCGKTIHDRPPPGEGGKGIQIPKGVSFTIPGRWLRLSLRPEPGKGLFRGGVEFVFQQLIRGDAPADEANLEQLLEGYRKGSDEILEKSPLLDDLDLDDEANADEAWGRLSKKKGSREWWAALRGTFGKLASDAVGRGDAQRAAWAMYHAAMAHVMLIYKSELEDLLWRGYLAARVVHESAVAAARTSAEAEAIRNLEPLFSRQPDSVLYTWVHGTEPIGPKIGVKEIPEETLKNLAAWELAYRERRHEDERHRRAERREDWKLRLQGVGIALAVVTFVWGIVKLLIPSARLIPLLTSLMDQTYLAGR